jgi:hypothetical protein
MNVIGISTSMFGEMTIHFSNQLCDYVLDGRKARGYCDQVSDWLKDQFGIDHESYIIRDVFSTKYSHLSNHHYSRIRLDMAKDREAFTILKLSFDEY